MKSVAINGFGTIGKRVADAVAAQDDMKVIGVSKTRPNFEAKTAVEEKGYPLYIGIPEREQQFKDAGIEIAGTVEEMIQEETGLSFPLLSQANIDYIEGEGEKIYHIWYDNDNKNHIIVTKTNPITTKSIIGEFFVKESSFYKCNYNIFN